MKLIFGPPGNLLAFPVHKRLRMTGRDPLGPAKVYDLEMYRSIYRYAPTPLKPIPRRRKAG